MHIVSHIAITHNEWPNEHYKYMKTCAKRKNTWKLLHFLCTDRRTHFFVVARYCAALCITLRFFFLSFAAIFVLQFAPNPSIHIWVVSYVAWIQCCICRCFQLQTALFRPCLATLNCGFLFICLTFTRKRVQYVRISVSQCVCFRLAYGFFTLCVCVRAPMYVCVNLIFLHIEISSLLHDCILNYPAKMTVDKNLKQNSI